MAAVRRAASSGAGADAIDRVFGACSEPDLGHCWRIRFSTSGGDEACESGGSGFRRRPAGPPIVETVEVEGGSAGEVLQAGLGETDIAGATQAADAHRLPEGALDAGARVVERRPGLAIGLPRAHRLHRLIFRLRPHREQPSRPARAALARRAGAAN